MSLGGRGRSVKPQELHTCAYFSFSLRLGLQSFIMLNKANLQKEKNSLTKKTDKTFHVLAPFIFKSSRQTSGLFVWPNPFSVVFSLC